MSDNDSGSTPDADSQRFSRRAALRAGAVALTAAGLGGIELARRTVAAPDRVPPSSTASSPTSPYIRWSLRTSTEGWQASEVAPQTSVSNDPSGWLLATGTGIVGLESMRRSLSPPMDWSLDDRDTADRVTLSVRVDGASQTYKMAIDFCWQQGGVIRRAKSAEFDVPVSLDIDVDSWWGCDGTTPSDVLRRIQGLKITVVGDGPFEVRMRDIRQPPSTAPSGDITGVASTFFAVPPSSLPEPEPADAYQQAVLSNLTNLIDWGRRNNRALHIGEWAWPKESRQDTPGSSVSDRAYGEMAEQWLRLVDSNAIPYTPWGESAYWSGSDGSGRTNYGSYPDASYFCGGPLQGSGRSPRVINRMKPSASILENHIGRVPGVLPSINLVGMCFVYLRDGTEFSSSNIGKRGSDYISENVESIAYLHSRGYRMFRLAFRWDRVMRTPEDDALDPEEWSYVSDAIDDILTFPDTSVIIDQHSSAQFWISPKPSDRSAPATRYSVDDQSGRLKTSHMVHFWELASDALRDRSDRLIYEITNEPKNSSPFIVRRYTQAVVSALRSRGDKTFFLIPSYPFNNVRRAIDPENHPFPWIDDAAGTRRHAYTFHHYMDYEQSGAYALTYDETLALYE